MFLHGYKIIVDDVEQLLYYFVLPKSPNDHLNINLPLIIQERIDLWIKSESIEDLFLDASNNKYTFRDAVVDRETRCVNRYGVECRDIYIRYKMMLNGFQRRK